MKTCPRCKGTGKIQIGVCEIGKKPDFFPANCFTCQGVGTLKDSQLQKYQYEKEMWCKCGKHENPSDWVFYEDDQHSILKKHHYRCPECDGVKQVG